MRIKRRIFLQRSAAGGVAMVAAATGLLVPGQLLATWSDAAFSADNSDGALAALYGNGASVDGIESSDSITIKAPDIAENGAVVPVSVSSSMAGVTSIAIVAAKNGTPLTAQFDLGARTLPEVSTRIKMGKTSQVIAVVTANGKLYKASKEVKVTIGGCGG
jgi:sulfur-oxidizing protein SoxY